LQNPAAAVALDVITCAVFWTLARAGTSDIEEFGEGTLGDRISLGESRRGEVDCPQNLVGACKLFEECGHRDPSGAPVGAILQALIAREPVERRPTIRAWLPRGFVPPQVTVLSAKPSTEVMTMRSLGLRRCTLGSPVNDVLYWRSDIF
jgi:hypothetical protein